MHRTIKIAGLRVVQQVPGSTDSTSKGPCCEPIGRQGPPASEGRCVRAIKCVAATEMRVRRRRKTRSYSANRNCGVSCWNCPTMTTFDLHFCGAAHDAEAPAMIPKIPKCPASRIEASQESLLLNMRSLTQRRVAQQVSGVLKKLQNASLCGTFLRALLSV